jgi:transposase
MSELADAIVAVSQGVQRLLTSYEVSRNPDELDFLLYQVHKLYRIAAALNGCNNEVLETIGIGLSLLQELQDVVNTDGYAPQLLTETCRGRPRLDIKKEQLEYLLHMGFSCPKIAAVIGVSLSTIRRRMSEYGLCVTELYSNVTDQELDSLVAQIKENFQTVAIV